MFLKQIHFIDFKKGISANTGIFNQTKTKPKPKPKYGLAKLISNLLLTYPTYGDATFVTIPIDQKHSKNKCIPSLCIFF